MEISEVLHLGNFCDLLIISEVLHLGNFCDLVKDGEQIRGLGGAVEEDCQTTPSCKKRLQGTRLLPAAQQADGGGEPSLYSGAWCVAKL